MIMSTVRRGLTVKKSKKSEHTETDVTAVEFDIMDSDTNDVENPVFRVAKQGELAQRNRLIRTCCIRTPAARLPN